ncbi:MAG: DUF2752 domain-containing protein [Planctomycetes bacterium]|nr:DUF2752 domain-containing protein [Planctomycetota bacterium]
MHTGLAQQIEKLAPAAQGVVLLSGPQRVKRALWVLSCVVVVSLAAWLEPNEAGYGTHRGLGLPACGFMQRTGLPCPGCGMTTSMSLMAHGKIMPAARAHLMGVVLFAVLVALGAVWCVEAVSGIEVSRPKWLRPAMWWVPVTLGLILLAWAIKLLDVLWDEMPLLF